MVIGDVVAQLKPQKIHPFVRFIMNCIITTVPVAFYWARNDNTVHYKSDERVNFCRDDDDDDDDDDDK